MVSATGILNGHVYRQEGKNWGCWPRPLARRSNRLAAAVAQPMGRKEESYVRALLHLNKLK